MKDLISINLEIYSKYFIKSGNCIIIRQLFNSFVNFLKPEDNSFKIRLFLAKHSMLFVENKN